MQTYSGTWAPRCGFLFLSLPGFGMLYFVVNGLIRNTAAPHIDMLALLFILVPWGLLGLLLGCLSLYGIADSCSVYRIDDNHIEKRAPVRTTSLSWSSVIDFQYNGSEETRITLEGEFGERLEIDFGLIHDPRGEFRAAVERCLHPIRDRRQQELQWRERSSSPNHVASLGSFFFGLLLLGFGAAVLLDPQIVSDSLAERIGTGLFFLCISTVPILLGVNFFLSRLTVRGDAIASDSLFHHRSIPFARVEEFVSRTTLREDGPTRHTTVIGAGQQISFSDSLPDYKHIRDYIGSHIDPRATARGEAGLPARIARASRRESIAVTLFVSVCIGALIGVMAWLSIVPAQQRLARQISLDAHGVTVAGHITGVRGPWSEDNGTYVDYAFPAGGKAQSGFTSVAQSVYAAARPGQPIAITYLPGDPTVNRSTYTARVHASSVRPYWCRLFALIGVYPPLITAFALFSKTRSKRAAIA